MITYISFLVCEHLSTLIVKLLKYKKVKNDSIHSFDLLMYLFNNVYDMCAYMNGQNKPMNEA